MIVSRLLAQVPPAVEDAVQQAAPAVEEAIQQAAPIVEEVVQQTAPRIIDEFLKGGVVMWPLLGLSIFTLATALERSWFWIRLVSQEQRIVDDVLAAARYDLRKAEEIAEYARHLAIGRFLLAPLQLRQSTPETFRLAMESIADKEFAKMRKGDKLLETIIAVSPLLGLLGTVSGLISTFGNLNIGGSGSAEETAKAAAGIGEALITTAAGMLVAILALLVFRVFVTLQAQQIDYFTEVGSELELIYRQIWYEPGLLVDQHVHHAAGQAAATSASNASQVNAPIASGSDKVSGDR